MSSRRVTIAGWATILAGVGLVAVHHHGGAPGDPEGWFSAVGFAAPIAGAGALAVVGARTTRPELCVAAGVALAVMSVVSVVMFPLLIAAVAMATAASDVPSGRRTVAVPAAFAVALVADFAMLVFHRDPVSWSGGSSSDIVTNVEATISLIVVVVVVGGAVLWSVRPVHGRDRAMPG